MSKAYLFSLAIRGQHAMHAPTHNHPFSMGVSMRVTDDKDNPRLIEVYLSVLGRVGWENLSQGLLYRQNGDIGRHTHRHFRKYVNTQQEIPSSFFLP
jgi:hypothetical protein